MAAKRQTRAFTRIKTTFPNYCLHASPSALLMRALEDVELKAHGVGGEGAA
jgi:hypothetical protein